MIKSVEFKNFRNINGKYIFNNNLNVIVGKNNSGKTIQEKQIYWKGLDWHFHVLPMIILKYL